MIFHVVSLPHTQTTKEYLTCAYTQKVIKFCRMMKSLGHTVYLYASEENEAPCDELITCISKKYKSDQYLDVPFEANHPDWVEMNKRVIEEMTKRKHPHDFICLIAGLCQKPIADAFPEMMSVEYGIGYGGVFAKYKVFESYAWKHTVYGSLNRDPHAINGQFYDRVIPNSFDPGDFPFSLEKKDYFLYIGRLIDRKGYKIAQEVCQKLNKRLIVCGPGNFSGYGEYKGVVGVKERGELMSMAQAVFCPTLYIEPFGGVTIEAMMCGTPVISTDWGAFTETVIHGKTGYRCRTFKDFVEAVKKIEILNPLIIRDYARNTYSIDEVKFAYQKYFEQLNTLWDDGWYSLRPYSDILSAKLFL